MWFLALLLVFVPSTFAQLCGGWGKMTSGQRAIFSSPYYPNFYPSSTKCEWVIEIPSAATITVECKNFNVLQSHYCSYDYLAVSVSGLSSYTPHRKFCGNNAFKFTIRAKVFRAIFRSSFYSYYRPNRYNNGFMCEVTFTEDSTSPEVTESLPTDTERPSSFSTSSYSTEYATEAVGSASVAYTTVSSFPNVTSSAKDCECGIKNAGRIVGGELANLHEYPWQAMLRTSSGSHYCGGTLISPNYILTASHCVDGMTADDIIVSLGDHQKSTSSETDKTVHMRVEEVIMHESYNDNTIDNDVALLRLENPVEFTDAISPACLPFGKETMDLSGQTGTVTGWGTTTEGGSTSETLKEVDLPVLTTSECQMYYGRSVTDNMICTYKPGEDSCQGDSGGPLVVDDNGKNYLMGVVSWGSGCAQTNAPGVYAKVTNYLDWIEENTGETFCKA